MNLKKNSTSSNSMESKRGFTLIEVVIALGVLGATLTVIAMFWAPNAKRSTTLLHRQDLYNNISLTNAWIHEQSFDKLYRSTQSKEAVTIDPGVSVELKPSVIKDISGIALDHYSSSYFAMEVILSNQQDSLTYTAVKHR